MEYAPVALRMSVTRAFARWAALAAAVAALATPAFAQQSSLSFNGSSQYVTFGVGAPLGAPSFTLECWVRRASGGATTSTGTGGVTAYPLVTKGRGEAENSNVDCNYFLGIDAAGHLCADYEEGAGRVSPGLNHPVIATSVLAIGVWYHVAASYDSSGGKWRLYVNGVLDGSLDVGAGKGPRFDSIQHAALATAMNSTGVAAGFFAGVLDEARVWNVVRSQADIQASMNAELTSGAGLQGRWGLNEGSGTAAANSIVTSPTTNGTLSGAPAWTAATVFAAPAAPGTLSANAVSSTRVQLGWTDNSTNELSFELERSTTGASGSFVPLVVLGQGVTSWDDNTVTGGTEYCYRVRATNPGGASSYAPVACAMPAVPLPPADPSNLVATAVSNTQVNLTWTDNAGDETSYELERSVTGAAGTYTLFATLAANATSYSNTGLLPAGGYCYRVRAVNGNGPSAYAGPACATTAASGALDLGSASAYVSFGNPATLKLAQFTIELWMRRDGAGTGANTGSGGIADAIPLVSKGMADGEVSSKDVNYLFGIKAASNLLCADFEEDTSGASRSLNHPILGTTAIPADGVWRHVAVTYDGTWKLYLNGALDAQLVVNQPPAFSSDVAVALGRALILSGTPSGNFDGAMDEVRIWSYARTQFQLQTTANSQITTPTMGLVARWALDEGGGSAVSGSAGTAIAGTLLGTGYTWTLPAPYDVPLPPPPAAPSGLAASAPTATRVQLAWTDNATNEQSFELERSTAGAGGPFAFLASLPPNTLNYDDTSVVAGQEYCYQVRAVNAGGASPTTPVACATTPAPQLPGAPTNLVATAPTHALAWLTWTDNAVNETAFELERSTTGIGGAYSLVTTLAPNMTSCADTSRQAGASYCYRVRAVNADGASAYAGPACVTTPASASTCVDFVGRSAAVNAYANLGNLPALHLSAFTVEAWIRRDSVGVGNTSGTGGIDSAVPIVAKGIAEAENPDADVNFLLGIQVSTGLLCADFEEAQSGASPSLNHPVYGTIPILADSTWHHVAASYDGLEWRLYLDGALNGQTAVGQPCNSANVSPASIGSALKTDGSPLGFFHGRIDEVRVWSTARTLAEIQSTINSRLASATPGLAARWGLDDGSGTVVGESVGGVGGTLRNTFYSWQPGAPFDWAPVTPPADPGDVVVTACSQVDVELTWSDHSNDETGFQVERAATAGGPFSLLATTAANATSYSDLTVAPSTPYCYRVRAIRSATPSGYAGPLCVTTPAAGSNALDLAGTNAYVNFGTPAALNLGTFTLEMWVRRAGTGTGTSTGTGGIADAVPLLAKGRAEAETQAADINYLFAIQQSTGVLCADFEEAQSGASPGLNHPVLGTTPLAIGAWHHVAATYDGLNWKLYLDGVLDASADAGQPVNNANSVAVSLGSALTTAGVAAGFFDGVVDEVRIWNYAREQSQIVLAANAQITTPQSGLVARWAMDEGSGGSVAGSAGTAITGALTGTYAWGCGTNAAPFGLAFNSPPLTPSLVSPADGATGVPAAPSLDVAVTDPDGDAVTVTYYGRVTNGVPGPDFTLIGLPDTQYYTGQLNGGTNAMFRSQTQWVVSNLVPRNIAYAVQLGDCTEHGNNGNNSIEWQRADTALAILENPATTGMSGGLPYGVCAGNHDQSPIGVELPDTTTRFYNQFFGASRFTGRGYYGGHYGGNNDNWYELFSASGMDFIVIGLEYDATPDAAVLAWADQLLTTHAGRRAIVASHFICNTGNPGGFGPQGQAIYTALKGHPNLFLMLCGHVPGEGRRQDTFNNSTVHTLLSDYQSRTNGGSGWLRILEFSPANNVIRVRTYSPWLDQFEADADSSSQFTLPYVMTSAPPFQVIGSITVPSGSTASLAWPGRNPGATYEWYAELTDGVGTRTGPVWSFTTAALATHTLTASAGTGGTISPSGAVPVAAGGSQTFTIAPAACFTIANVLVDGTPQGPIGSYTFGNVQASHVISATFAHDDVPPASATALTAGQVVSGNDADGTTKVTMTFAPPVDGSTVQIYRAGFGNYPSYQSGTTPGSDPTQGLSLPLSGRWQETTVTASGQTDEVATRDFWYYVAVTNDGCGNRTLSAPTTGVLNYRLGDVANGLAPCQGNDVVDVADISALGAAYGAHLDADDPRACMDVGPTVGHPVSGRPQPDGILDFEDLILYTINFGPRTGPPALATRFGPVRSAVSSIGLEIGPAGEPGSTFEVPIHLEGAGDFQALSVALAWEPGVVEPVGVRGGPLLDRQAAPARLFSARPGTVDAAVFGRGAVFEGSGEVGRVVFRVLRQGDPGIRVSQVRARDGANAPVTLSATAGVPARAAPSQAEMASAFPNPFTGSTRLVIGLPRAGQVQVAVYDVLGRAVRHLTAGEAPAGWSRLTWDGRGDDGRRLPQGSYVVRMVTGDRRISRTLRLVR